jgi:hypothetical protein
VLANPIDERSFAFGSGFRLQAPAPLTPAKQLKLQAIPACDKSSHEQRMGIRWSLQAFEL